MLDNHLLLVLVFWASGAAVVYSYVLYPIIICLCAKTFGNKARTPQLPESKLPAVSLLVAAHNEQAVIESRILNALAIDYPSDQLEILIASDGSTDQTASIVARFHEKNVRLLDYPARRGKAATLNAAVREANGEILLLSDANTCTDPDAVRALVRWFRDPAVGVVCGRLILTDPATGRNADGVYWKYETFLKKCEGRLGALLGSNGAIYAMRKDLFVPIPPDTIVDDFVIPLLAKQRTGCAIIYECGAVAREETAPDIGAEFRRRSRIGAGGFQAIGMLWRLLDPRRGWIAFTFLSHKILRWLCPFFLIAVLFANFPLASRPFYQVTLAVQVVFYLASWAGSRAMGSSPLLKPLRIAGLFTGMNLALLAGFFRWWRGGQKPAWDRTARSAEVAEPLVAAVAMGPQVFASRTDAQDAQQTQ